MTEDALLEARHIVWPDFGSLYVFVARDLTGSRRAIRQGKSIYVSPAMFDLMKHADADELKRLLEAIHVVTIPEIDEILDGVFSVPDAL
jgi:hypothetical protein